MKDYSASLNAANTAPNSAPYAFRGARKPVKAMSAGEDHDPGHSPTSPQKPAVPFDQVNNPAPYAAEVVEMNDND